MLKKVVSTIAFGLLISYPLAAATLFEDVTLAKPSKLGTLRIAVDPQAGVAHTELLALGGDKVQGPGTYMKNPPIQIHDPILGDSIYHVCPTCDNCPDIEEASRGEILLLCLCFNPASDMSMMVLPTAGQKYGFELVPYDGAGGHLRGSATAATVEVVCAQAPPAKGYEFDYYQHCGVAIHVEVANCDQFEVWYDVMGTVWSPP